MATTLLGKLFGLFTSSLFIQSKCLGLFASALLLA